MQNLTQSANGLAQFAAILWPFRRRRETLIPLAVSLACLGIATFGLMSGNILASVTALVCLVLACQRIFSRNESTISLSATGTVGVLQAAPPARRVKRVRNEEFPATPKTSEALVNEMIFQGRYAVLLRPELVKNLSERQKSEIERVFQEEMCEVLGGQVMCTPSFQDNNEAPPMVFEVERFYVDRYAVNNADFQEFVNANGYGIPDLWDPRVRNTLSTFNDLSQRPGPRFWRHGKYPAGQAELPVVGVSWYEADAYARWAGKRLPIDAEWVKASSSARASMVAVEQLVRFPWGNGFREDRANLWAAGKGQPIPVADYPGGQSAEGVYQLIGNVWEWMQNDLADSCGKRELLGASAQFKSLRGGAFDTYLESQAACQSVSGDSALARRDNVGFRCVVSADGLVNVSSKRD